MMALRASSLFIAALLAVGAHAFLAPKPGMGLCAPTRAGLKGRAAVKLNEPNKPSRVETFDPLGKTLMEDEAPLSLVLGGGSAVEPVGEEKGEQDNSFYKALLLVVAVIWGSNFGALKYLDTCGVDVSIITAIRFALASLSLVPFLLKAEKGVIPAGLEVGLWVSLGYITQAIGLETTQANKSAFICSLTVVVVPLINGLLGKKINNTTWAACLLAVMGVGLLTLQGQSANPDH
jgi:hypothetical protein